jgi:CMP-N,N'-diacetyllegionaminic acid synthase
MLWAHPTNPLVSSATYDAAIVRYIDGLLQGYDSLFSVYRVQRHAWFDRGPLNYDAGAATKSHPLAAQTAPVFFQDGAIFIQPRSRMIRNRYFFGASPVLFETPAEQVGDIDTRADYEQCTPSS